jgi:VWFA-related protein
MPGHKARRVISAGLFLLVASAFLRAQEAPVFRTTTQLVEIDTVAVDSHGKPITDLKAEDFKLFEDGKERPVSHFSFEEIEPLDDEELDHIHELAKRQKPGVYANFTENTAAVPSNGCTVLLIDWQNTPLELQGPAQQELKKFLETVDLSKPLAIYSLDASLHQLQSFTSDREVLRSNVEKYGVHSVNLQPEKQADSSLHSQTTDARVMNAASALLSIAGSLDWIKGHKSLIWLSGSFPSALIPTNRKGMKWDMERNQGGWTYGEHREYSGVIEQVAHALSASNIAIYPVDAEGLQGHMADASVDDPQYLLNPITQSIMARQQSMRDLADLTGGRAFYNHNDISDEIASAYQDADSFYALGFTPASSAPDSKVHALRVECVRPGVKLRYRKSYFADDKKALDDMKRAQLELLVRMLGHASDALPIMAEIDKHDRERLDIWLDGSSLSMPTGEAPLAVDVAVAIFDHAGNILQQNYADMSVKLTADQLHSVQSSGLSQTLQFVRSKEAASLRIAVRDQASGRVGTLEVPLQ